MDSKNQSMTSMASLQTLLGTILIEGPVILRRKSKWVLRIAKIVDHVF